jgi:hypothetical protein
VIGPPGVVMPGTGPGVPDMPPAGTPLPPGGSDGTYPYDGGPSNPVPLPGPRAVPTTPTPSAPTTGPRPVAPAKGSLLVSYPPRPAAAPASRPASGFAYPAYGEDTRASSFATDRIRRTPTQGGGR